MACHTLLRALGFRAVPEEVRVPLPSEAVDVAQSTTVEAFLGNRVHEALERLYRDVAMGRNALRRGPGRLVRPTAGMRNGPTTSPWPAKTYGPEDYRRSGQMHAASLSRPLRPVRGRHHDRPGAAGHRRPGRRRLLRARGLHRPARPHRLTGPTRSTTTRRARAFPRSGGWTRTSSSRSTSSPCAGATRTSRPSSSYGTTSRSTRRCARVERPEQLEAHAPGRHRAPGAGRSAPPSSRPGPRSCAAGASTAPCARRWTHEQALQAPHADEAPGSDAQAGRELVDRLVVLEAEAARIQADRDAVRERLVEWARRPRLRARDRHRPARRRSGARRTPARCPPGTIPGASPSRTRSPRGGALGGVLEAWRPSGLARAVESGNLPAVAKERIMQYVTMGPRARVYLNRKR